MDKEPSIERRRRSDSPSPTTDRYGRRARDRARKDEREYRRDLEGDSSTERSARSKRRRHSDDERGREKSYPGWVLDGDPRKSSNYTSARTHENYPRTQSALSDGNIKSRWGNAFQDGDTANGATKIDERFGFRRGERNNGGGMYGPADRGGGGAGRGLGDSGVRDESWLEHRLKLRAEAKLPRRMWNTSPSPPRRKAPKVTNVGNANHGPDEDRAGKMDGTGRHKEAGKKGVHRRSISKKDSRRKTTKRKVPSNTNGSSSSTTTNGSSSDSNDSGSNSDESGSNSDRGERADGKNAARKPLSTNKTGLFKGKDAKPASQVSTHLSPGEADTKALDKSRLLPVDELDELDAAEAAQFRAEVQGHRHHEARDSDDEAGPMPVPQLEDLQGEGDRGVNYGGALLPGEGAAIAQFVQKGLRIPRRGEVGWAGQEIEKLESSGYVMSGSRHARMNAVRLRKENQVFNAEERRALALIMFEEKQQKENEILTIFRQMLTESNAEGEKKSAEGGSSI